MHVLQHRYILNKHAILDSFKNQSQTDVIYTEMEKNFLNDES